MLVPAFASGSAPLGRQVMPFDSAWRFHRGDVKGAEQPGYDDTTWHQIGLPHDWSIEGPFAENQPTGVGGAFLPAGIGWYRKTFTLPAALSGRVVSVEFDGIMADSRVWLNGRLLGQRPNGYVMLRYDLTPLLHFGDKAPNVLTVCADNSAQPASRWYAGAGIYRHVRLVVVDPVHLEPQSVFVTTPLVSAASSTISVQATIQNTTNRSQTIALKVALTNPEGVPAGAANTTAQTIAIGQTLDLKLDLQLANPTLWSPDQPALYQLAVQVLSPAGVLDSETVAVGVRQIKFDAVAGFQINGQSVKLKGVCLHQDGGAFGTAVPLAIWEHRLAALRSIGVNAIRTSHNPPAPEFLSLCDRLGFLVMLESFDAWHNAKPAANRGYNLYFANWWGTDLHDIVVRDRNHPCIVLYSIGNEIPDDLLEPQGHTELTNQRDLIHRLDPTRPVTMALFRPREKKQIPSVTSLLDVVGINYRPRDLATIVNSRPPQPTVDTEETHVLDRWSIVRDTPGISGLFLWTGIDYLGESLGWPVIGQDFGLLDRIGEFKPRGYQRQSWWSTQPMLKLFRRTGADGIMGADPGYETTQELTHRQLSQMPVLFPDWSPQKLTHHPEIVEIYSNCDRVDLYLNDKLLGGGPMPKGGAPLSWTVSFEPGILKAVGKIQNKVVTESTVRTADSAARLLLQADRTTLSHDWNDVLSVRTTVVDAQGTRLCSGNQPITFTLTGPGVVAAVDNGDTLSHEPFQGNKRLAYQGQCMAFLKAADGAGTVTLTATTPGLEPGTLKLEVLPVAAPPP